MAVLSEDFCQQGFLSSIYAAEVHVHPANNPSDDTVLLAVDSGGEPDGRPVVAWSSPTQLSVTVPNLSDPNILQTRVGAIEMQLHFDPDDPKARAAWMKDLKRIDNGTTTFESAPSRDTPPRARP